MRYSDALLNGGQKPNPMELRLMLTKIGSLPGCLSTRTVTLHPIGKSGTSRVGGMIMRTLPLSRIASVSTASSNPTITVCGMGAAAYPIQSPNWGTTAARGRAMMIAAIYAHTSRRQEKLAEYLN
jgi:hypothetical protein